VVAAALQVHGAALMQELEVVVAAAAVAAAAKMLAMQSKLAQEV
jgi:hypothetical protein